MRPADAEAPLGRDVWIVVGVVVLGVFVSILDTTIVNVALQTLARELAAPLDTIQWVATLVGLVLLALFARHGWRAERPLVDVRLFARRCFRPAAIAITLAGAALFGSILVLALSFQAVRGESALDTGLLLAPQGLGAAAVMPLAGRLTDRVGGGRVATVGFALLALGTVPLALATTTPPMSCWQAR